MKVKRVSKIWLRISTTKYSLTTIQSLKFLVKTWTLNAGTSGLIPKKNCLKFLTLHSPFRFFIMKNKTKQNKTKQNKTKQNKTNNLQTTKSKKQNKTKQKQKQKTKQTNKKTPQTEWPSWVLWNLLFLIKPSYSLQNGSFEHKKSKI